MKFVSIFESNDSFELNIIKIELKKEGIIFRILNENALEIGNVYVLGNNGAIIQVQEDDAEQTKLILKNLNIEISSDPENDVLNFVSYFEKKTNRIPFLNKFHASTRLVISFFLLISIPLVLLGLSSIKSISQKLIVNMWCLDEIIHKGDTLSPNTNDYIKIRGLGCSEKIDFKKNKGIFLPGFQTNKSQGQWKLDKKNDRIILINVFNNKEVYEGEYEFQFFSNGNLELESSNTKMKLSPWNPF